MTGGMDSSNMLFLLRASLDPPGTPIPANPWGITGSTPVNVSGLAKAPSASTTPIFPCVYTNSFIYRDKPIGIRDVGTGNSKGDG